MSDPADVQRPAISAAAVVLLRDSRDSRDRTGALRTLLLRRPARGTFADSWVFPGGRVEDTDRDAPDPWRAAAVRELAEEAGLTVESDELVPYERWCPAPGTAVLRFDTLFYVAEYRGRDEVRIDGAEIVGHSWLAPGQAIRRHTAGSLTLVPPTWVTLRRLARFSTAAEVLDHARDSEAPLFASRPVTGRDGVSAVLWQQDAGYEDADLAVPGPRHRLHLGPGPWRYECSGTVPCS